ncbi:MAG: TlpA disulfide reductase family protein, partial [Bacteroidota bacterium]
LTEEGAASAIESLDNPILGAMVATNVYGANPQYLNVHQQLNEQIGKVMPNSPLYRKHGAMVRQLIAAANDPIQIGKIPPNIQLTDPEGKTYSLDQLKGKVVLLDFWASWCGPCRRENPNVVRVYDKYNKEGFEVFSVSLDKQNGKQRWVNAIEKDNLKWPYHVSDLQGWNSAPAKEYKVSSIPRTFLLDRDGKIAEMNPRGPALEKAVKKLLGKG